MAPMVEPNSTSSRRQSGWLIAVAFVLLVALFGGMQVYRTRKQNAAVEASLPASLTTVKRPEPSAETQPTTPPGQPSTKPSSETTTTPEPATSSLDKPAQTANPTASEASTARADGTPPSGSTPEELAAHQKLVELRELLDQFNSRSLTVGGVLSDLHKTGARLPADIVQACVNLRMELGKAKQALDGGDGESAKVFLDQAAHELDKLEAFVGR